MVTQIQICAPPLFRRAINDGYRCTAAVLEHPAALFAAFGLTSGTHSLQEPTNLEADPLASFTAHDLASTFAQPTTTYESYITHSQHSQLLTV
jgi:hypothetical protein